ncbi:MAG: OmpA family protein [Pseudomonadota bacterium]
MRLTKLALAGAAGFALAGCALDPNTDDTATGAILGGAFGAIAGEAIGDGRGAIVGGLIGAGVGGAIGNAIDQQEAALRQDLAGTGARIINTGSELVVSLPEAILFDIESAIVRPNSRQNIGAIARNLQQFPNTVVQVVGHTDNTGTRAFNQGLSIDRATAVANILIGNGVNPGRIQAFGRGEDQPVASNATPAGRQANRRTEIIIRPTA